MPGAFYAKPGESSQLTQRYTVYSKMLSARSLVILVLTPLLVFGQQTLKVNVDLVNVFISVQDERNEFVTDLHSDDFVVYDDGQPQKIAVFEKDTAVRSALGILIDTSGSVVDILPYEIRGIREFVKTIAHPDQYFVTTFGTIIRLI